MKKLLCCSLLAAGVLAALGGCASSTRILRGEEAREAAGDDIDLLEPGRWSTLAIRDRRGGTLLAVIFNSGAGRFRLVKRNLLDANSNPYNLIVLNDPEGAPGFAPYPELLGEIRGTDLVPEIILDEAGVERARVYRSAGQPLQARIQEDGRIRIELGRRRDRGGSVAYSMPLYGVPTPPPAAGPTPIETDGRWRLGQAVRWEKDGKVRVGAIKAFGGDGTCLVNVATEEGLEEQNIPIDLLRAVGEE